MWRNKHRLFFLAVGVLLSWPGLVFADTSSSTNYRVDQTFFGSGGELDASSASYRAKQAAGELTVGLTESAAFRAYAGFNTTDEPFIEFFVTQATVDLGDLDIAQAKTGTGTFYVRAWQAHSYQVRTQADPPTNVHDSAEQIDPMTAGGTSSPGTEQFGINLVANTSPSNFGANPLQVPDATFSFGDAAVGYDTPNNYRYNKGDIIAESSESTSVTVYTISYLFNISSTTPSGQYDFNHDLVATATY